GRTRPCGRHGRRGERPRQRDADRGVQHPRRSRGRRRRARRGSATRSRPARRHSPGRAAARRSGRGAAASPRAGGATHRGLHRLRARRRPRAWQRRHAAARSARRGRGSRSTPDRVGGGPPGGRAGRSNTARGRRPELPLRARRRAPALSARLPGTPVPRVLVVGSANVDFTVTLSRLPRPGETVSEGTLLVARGGKAANQAVAARRLGAEVRLIACVGDDASGREVRDALAAEGIGIGALTTAAGPATGTALIVVDREGRNQIAVAPGANRALTVADVERCAADFAWAEVVVCSLEVPLAVVRRAREIARGRQVTTRVNPAPFPDGGIDFLALADYVTPNEGEAARLAGTEIADLDSARTIAAVVRGHGAG